MSKHRKLLKIFLLGILISMCLFLYAAYFNDVKHPGLLRPICSTTNRSKYGNDTYKRISVAKGTKNILLWESFFWGYRFGLGRTAFVNVGCRVSNCLITYNASLMPHEDFDAILIHTPTQKTPHIFKNRRPDQMLVMFTTEPPVHMPQNMKVFDNYFNWTITYRTGSTFHLKYGEIAPLESAPSTVEEAMAMRQQMMRSGINPAKGKTKLAIWLASNCNARSNRQKYVKLLKKFTTIDIFSKNGLCGGRDECPRDKNGDVCYDLIEHTYKFFLAFENSICAEYVTEKFFEMMSRNIVPVVLGGVDYAAIAPPHSYINALDYTPHQLAEYLNELDRNDTLYAEYFWWKPHYRVNNLYETNRQVFCDLCEALHSTPLEKSTVKGLQTWYMKQAYCVNNPVFEEN
ncbi:Alpha--fucosyltransferase C [Daphnia magna]|uniref:Fucosyltransferase n=1 Tax=Daphnia magna TaxID=35525 RepID=A0A0P5T2P9_9CRUS|nr:Alpha--fucosyltransferase C [Daphnia magna]